MNAIKTWLASKGGLAHVIALSYIFLVAAYAVVPSFHQLVITIHQSLPAWLQEVATTAVALFAFYKTWNAQPISGKEPTV